MFSTICRVTPLLLRTYGSHTGCSSTFSGPSVYGKSCSLTILCHWLEPKNYLIKLVIISRSIMTHIFCLPVWQYLFAGCRGTGRSPSKQKLQPHNQLCFSTIIRLAYSEVCFFVLRLMHSSLSLQRATCTFLTLDPCLVCTATVKATGPLANAFTTLPFQFGAGIDTINNGDDSTTTITVSPGYPVFGAISNIVEFSTNGLLRLGGPALYSFGSSGCCSGTPGPSTYQNVAGFWTDLVDYDRVISRHSHNMLPL